MNYLPEIQNTVHYDFLVHVSYNSYFFQELYTIQVVLVLVTEPTIEEF